MPAIAKSLERLISDFEANPLSVRRSIADIWESHPDEFLRESLNLLRAGPETAGKRFLVTFLLQREDLAHLLGDVRLLDRDEAIGIARLAIGVDPSLDTRLALSISSGAVRDDKSPSRILEILEAVSNTTNLLPMLGALTHHPNERVRSKVTLLIGKGNRNPDWVRQQLGLSDHRIRANAVEALWGLNTDAVCQTFEMSLQDDHPRVILNGLIGLYLAGQTDCLPRLAELAESKDDRLRNSVTWAMGKTQDPRFLPILTNVVRHASPQLRSNALRSLGRIRKYRELLSGLPPINIRIVEARIEANETRRIQLQVGHSDSLNVTPLSFVVEENSLPVTRYSVDCTRKAESVHVAVAIPIPLDLPPDILTILQTAWSQAMALRARRQSWAVSAYSNSVPPDECSPIIHSGHSRALHRPFDTPLRSAFSGYAAAVAALVQSAARESTLVVVGCSSPESASTVMLRDAQMENLLRLADARHVIIHTITPPGCTPRMCASLTRISSSTGGVAIIGATARMFSAGLQELFGAFQDAYTVSYDAPIEAPGERFARVLVHCPAGLGEHSAILAR